ncbi:hypothetical protein BDQ12DRAFT_374820 [Crucibulum laeve]|uniref:F-box domain-containing protein n=1 Tax=Crucibulum laeve TaxID=68775 RepID=A0A5C3LM93_9AGAR|nr:hypothetical protein BDQ12DRAFT_374820 [Crucibulum laeve]
MQIYTFPRRSTFIYTGPPSRIGINTLPIEILGEIFTHCVPLRRAVASPDIAPLLLCHVCSHWRTVAFATPHLWSTLSIADIKRPWPNAALLSL